MSGTSERESSTRVRKARLVNVGFDDVELFRGISEISQTKYGSRPQYTADGNGTHIGVLSRNRGLPPPRPISLRMIDERGKAPMSYYLTSGEHFFSAGQGAVLSPLMLKMSLDDGSTSSQAILHAILALSCSHLGWHSKAFAYRASAVSLLSASLKAGCAVKVAFQNIATSMLLSISEVSSSPILYLRLNSLPNDSQIYHVSETSANWAIYLCGVKKIVVGGLMQTTIQDMECIVLKDWIAFYEVMARFTLTHWIGEPHQWPRCYETVAEKISTAKEESPRVGLEAADISVLGYSRGVFESISAITDLLLPFKMATRGSSEHQRLIRNIETRLVWSDHPLQHDKDADADCVGAATINHLYRLAARIYLNRAVLYYDTSDVQHQKLLEEAIWFLPRVQSEGVPWAFFIIGCEAHIDDQRSKILGMYPDKRSLGRSNYPFDASGLIKAFWNLDDLDTCGKLGYVEKLSGVISASPFLPVLS